MIIEVVRHTETEWNRDDIVQGQLDSPLTEALNLALNPTSKRKELSDFLNSFGVWMCSEVDSKLR